MPGLPPHHQQNRQMESAARVPASELYNAADALIAGNVARGNAQRMAIIDAAGSYTYADLARRVSRFAYVLERCGIEMEQRVVLCLHDSVDFPICFLGAIKAGVVPVPAQTRPLSHCYKRR